MERKGKIFIAILSTIFTSHAIADDKQPLLGRVYNAKEDSFISYSCSIEKNNLMECKFEKTSLRKKAYPEELAKKIEDAKKEASEAQKNSEKDSCKEVSVLRAILNGDEAIVKKAIADKIADREGVEILKNKSPAEKQDLLEGFTLLQEWCNSKSAESFLKLTKLQHDRDTRTCVVSTISYSLKFKKVDDGLGNGGWVAAGSAPSKFCGVVNLSRFEAAHTGSSTNWNYIDKAAVTNPKGEIFGSSCKEISEEEATYFWDNKRYNKVGCDYIEWY